MVQAAGQQMELCAPGAALPHAPGSGVTRPGPQAHRDLSNGAGTLPEGACDPEYPPGARTRGLTRTQCNVLGTGTVLTQVVTCPKAVLPRVPNSPKCTSSPEFYESPKCLQGVVGSPGAFEAAEGRRGEGWDPLGRRDPGRLGTALPASSEGGPEEPRARPGSLCEACEPSWWRHLAGGGRAGSDVCRLLATASQGSPPLDRQEQPAHRARRQRGAPSPLPSLLVWGALPPRLSHLWGCSALWDRSGVGPQTPRVVVLVHLSSPGGHQARPGWAAFPVKLLGQTLPGLLSAGRCCVWKPLPRSRDGAAPVGAVAEWAGAWPPPPPWPQSPDFHARPAGPGLRRPLGARRSPLGLSGAASPQLTRPCPRSFRQARAAGTDPHTLEALGSSSHLGGTCRAPGLWPLGGQRILGVGGAPAGRVALWVPGRSCWVQAPAPLLAHRVLLLSVAIAIIIIKDFIY